MEIHTMLLGCHFISDIARQALKKACCTIHSDVPGIDDIEIVELQYAGNHDRNIMYKFDVPVEIQIYSRNLYLFYTWNDQINGFELTAIDEPEQQTTETDDVSLGDLEEHPF